ncbi:hypothetical protein [Desulfopila sp. IMCC35008]|uniref:hypothetical protein n=1 Tax=Desulfopila sp. IMCC35008 TaxID=2653858 RepID=UPI0013D4D841|nr:hypothetical protein [Desulfopila sp. IMCC35008]
MSEETGGKAEIETFIGQWDDESGMRECFIALYDTVRDIKDVELSLVARPGVSFSLRPKHLRQQDRNLFGMIDVIDDNPEERWLSVCFYEDMIEDPDGLGEVIPGGLAGADGYCFDMYEADKSLTAYIGQRLREAYVKAGE